MVDKKLLAEKIDSEEKLNAAAGTATPTSRMYQNAMISLNGEHHTAKKQPWWHRRETLRIQYGIYRTSVLTEALNCAWPGQFAVHVSRDDPEQIAYTASPEDGERDKQLRMSPGRFLRKHFTLFSDKQIQDLEQIHKTDLDSSYLVARTKDTIYKVYTEMVGDTGCMRREAKHFPGNIHPSIIYTGPGFGVAYLQDKGKIIARCVIWVNPNDPNDKRAVRIYGHPTLRRKLLADGFVFKPLVGAKVAKVPVPGYDNHYYMSYLDGPEGNQSDRQASHAKISGDHIELISQEEASSLGQQASYARSTAGFIQLLPPPVEVEIRSVLSGNTFRKYADSCKECAVVDSQSPEGRIGLAPQVEITTQRLVRATFISRDGQKTVWARSDSVESGYVVNSMSRVALGMVQLDVAYYPPGSWARDVVAEHSTNRVIKKEDSFTVLDETPDSEMQYWHVTKPLPPKATHVKATPIAPKEPVLWIHKQRRTLKVFGTRTYFDTKLHRRKFAVLTGTNEVVRATQARDYHVLDKTIILPRTVPRSAMWEHVTEEMIVSYFNRRAATNDLRQVAAAMMAHIFSAVHIWLGREQEHWRPGWAEIAAFHADAARSATYPQESRVFHILNREVNRVR
jgi:hypothetical protein